MIIRRFPSSHNLRENGDRKYAFKNHNNNSPSKMPNNNSPNKNLLVALNNKLSKQSITHESSCTRFILNNEDSIRFFILAALIILYMTVGAAVFFALEEPHETERLKSFQTSLSLSMEDIKASIEGRNITMVQIEELLYLWGNASKDEIVSSNRKWDYAGSFHFVYTVVSTTGFGATVPNTGGGKIFLIFYGLLGCSSGVLFFNLFLERIITVITWIMKVFNKRQDESLQLKAHSEERSNDDDDVLDDWKPSVYWVIIYLTVFSATFGGLASLAFCKLENWSYLDSFYFSFVTFATIGFGDFVSAQDDSCCSEEGIYFYQFGNFIIMVTGTCCVYSLFNVISITIKQFLNWIIRSMTHCTAIQNYLPHLKMNSVTFSPVEKASKQDLVQFEQNDAERKLSNNIFTVQDSKNLKNSMNEKKEGNMRTKDTRDAASPVSRKISAGSRMLSASSRNFSRESFIPGHVGSIAIAASKLSDN